MCIGLEYIFLHFRFSKHDLVTLTEISSKHALHTVLHFQLCLSGENKGLVLGYRPIVLSGVPRNFFQWGRFNTFS
jgi:hypothetical protein